MEKPKKPKVHPVKTDYKGKFDKRLYSFGKTSVTNRLFMKTYNPNGYPTIQAIRLPEN